MKSYIIGTISVLLLSGCVATPRGEYPKNYKELVSENIRKTYFDPYSIRDLAISEPISDGSDSLGWWDVCVEANAKNRMGGYAGLTMQEYWIQGGIVTNSQDGNVPFSPCRTAKMNKWSDFSIENK